MNTNKKSLLSLLALVMLFSCAREPRQLVSEKNSVPTAVLESQKIKDATLCLVRNGGIVGRCFLVARDKVATNIHVMDGADPVSTYVRSRYATWSIRGVTAYDLESDLVILKISGEGVPLPLADSDTAQSGGTVSVVEYSGVIEYKVTEGTIHSIRNTDKWLRMKIDAPPGTSGSTVVNSEGKVIGVVARGDIFYAYAAPSNVLKALLTRSESTEPLAQWQQREQISAYHYCTQANQKYGEEHYEEAIVDLDKALQLNPEFIDAYYGRAATKLSIGVTEAKSENVEKARSLYHAAIEDLNEVIKLRPEYGDAFSTRGAAKIEIGKLESDTGNEKKAQALYAAAINDLTHAIKLEPKEFTAYYNRGIAKFKLGEFKYAHGNVKKAQDLYQRTIEDYTQVIKINPEHIYACNNRGYTKYILGKSKAEKGHMEEARKLYEAAISDVDKSIQLDSDSANAYRNRGAIKIVLGNPQDAIADFDKAIEMNPEYADAYYDRAQAKEALGQKDAAKADFEKAKALDPDVGQ
jgi:tetratricopeptide (TPR) repeat protein